MERRFRASEVGDVCTVNCSQILNFMSVRWSAGAEREIERREKGNASNRRGEKKRKRRVCTDGEVQTS